MNRLLNTDKTLFKLLKQEFSRQQRGLELIASENFTSLGVMGVLGSVLTNKYSEGLPGNRYYGGNNIIDKIENLCIKRALEAFDLDSEKWGVNVQPYSGSIANLAAYNGILNPNDRIMGLSLSSGGHLTHGHYTSNRNVSATSTFFQSLPYYVCEKGYIDYDKLEKDASNFKPKMIICGYSSYPRDLDYKRFRSIADINNSYLLCDMSHFSGLVSTKIFNNPFDYCDIVTSTTHKTLGGPRSGLIFYKKKFEESINSSVFPGIQGGPHQHQIGALCFQLNYVNSPEYKNYIKQVVKNSQTLSKELIKRGYKISTNGTDNHIILIDLRPQKITGNKIEKICEYIDISINKNSVPGDKSAIVPGGIRIGTPALTMRGMKENDFKKIAHILDRTINIAISIQAKTKSRKLKCFLEALPENDELLEIKKQVNYLAYTFDFYNHIE